MAINYVTGNIHASAAQAQVNPVNTVGVMGAGLALQYKRKYPQMFTEYQQLCRNQQLKVGQMHVWSTGLLVAPEYIINFPTKEHWRNPTKLEYISAGVEALKAAAEKQNIESVAMPAIGCGLGGLDWSVVQPILENALTDITIDYTVYLPGKLR